MHFRLYPSGGTFSFVQLCREEDVGIQGDPYGRGKDYVDIIFKVPSQAWVAGQTYSLTQLQIWSQHKLFRDHTGHPVSHN